MPPLSTPDRVFIEQRKSRRTMGLFVLPGALIALVVAWGAMWAFWPISVNPYAVMGRLEQQLFEPGTLAMYAITTTVLMNVIFALLTAFVILTIVWARHERRYLKLIAQQSQEEPAKTPPSKGSPVGV